VRLSRCVFLASLGLMLIACGTPPLAEAPRLTQTPLPRLVLTFSVTVVPPGVTPAGPVEVLPALAQIAGDVIFLTYPSTVGEIGKWRVRFLNSAGLESFEEGRSPPSLHIEYLDDPSVQPVELPMRPVFGEVEYVLLNESGRGYIRLMREGRWRYTALSNRESAGSLDIVASIVPGCVLKERLLRCPGSYRHLEPLPNDLLLGAPC